MQEKQSNNNQNQHGQNIWEQCRKYIPYFVVVVGIVLTGVVYLISVEDSVMDDGIILETTQSVTEHSTQISQEETNTEVPETKRYITVYVCGAVLQPDVYTLVEGCRLIDAINVAGGFTEDAWREGLNLARTIVDAEQIYVPTEAERLSGSIAVSNDLGSNSEANSGSSSSDLGKVNLNTATKDQLMSLPGIGEAKADSIITYRQQNGSFSSIEDIMKISGIKESVFNKIKEQITVE